VVALHNFADAEVRAAPVLQGIGDVELTDVLDPRADPVPVAGDGRLEVTLPPYGCRWLRLG
jgi:maltose alpha-D-glucosyltransferase/alpha-amylase